MQCTTTENTCELQAELNTLGYFNAKWHNKQLDMEITQLLRIYDNDGKAFTAPMCELFNRYAGVFTKPGKPALQDIKHKIEL